MKNFFASLYFFERIVVCQKRGNDPRSRSSGMNENRCLWVYKLRSLMQSHVHRVCPYEYSSINKLYNAGRSVEA